MKVENEVRKVRGRKEGKIVEERSNFEKKKVKLVAWVNNGDISRNKLQAE